MVAVRMADGRRIVFGRDDVKGDIGDAVHASSAIPAVYVPARIGTREYVDGAVHSATATGRGRVPRRSNNSQAWSRRRVSRPWTTPAASSAGPSCARSPCG